MITENGKKTVVCWSAQQCFSLWLQCVEKEEFAVPGLNLFRRVPVHSHLADGSLTGGTCCWNAQPHWSQQRRGMCNLLALINSEVTFAIFPTIAAIFITLLERSLKFAMRIFFLSSNNLASVTLLI